MVQSLIDQYQDDFPLCVAPYAEMAMNLNTTEALVMNVLSQMINEDLIGRVGPIYKTHKVGYSLLAACECSESELMNVAKVINRFQGINHNYERENKLNLWFVVTGKDEKSVYQICHSIEELCNVKVLCFPMVKSYKIDLSLREKIQWEKL
jgi:DNA-binding Lrp family transcriptional regulator